MLFYYDNIATVQIIKNGRSKEPLIMEYMRRLIMCAMLNNFVIFSDEICYEWTNFTKWIPENKIKFSLPELYNS